MGARFIQIAVFYFLFGVIAGMVLGSTQQFQFATFHAHVNLLGWVSLALSGLVYNAFPKAAQTGLAKAHFWLHNIGLPVFVIGLFLSIAQVPGAEPFIIAGGSVTVIGVLCFALNVWANVRASSSAAAASQAVKNQSAF